MIRTGISWGTHGRLGGAAGRHPSADAATAQVRGMWPVGRTSERPMKELAFRLKFARPMGTWGREGPVGLEGGGVRLGCQGWGALGVWGVWGWGASGVTGRLSRRRARPSDGGIERPGAGCRDETDRRSPGPAHTTAAHLLSRRWAAVSGWAILGSNQ